MNHFNNCEAKNLKGKLHCGVIAQINEADIRKGQNWRLIQSRIENYAIAHQAGFPCRPVKIHKIPSVPFTLRFHKISRTEPQLLIRVHPKKG